MTPSVVEIVGLSYCYPDGTPALDTINIEIRRGEKVALIGANGAGKSTLLLHLNGILRGTGAVRILGREVAPPNLDAIRRQVAMVFQNPDDQLFCATVFDDIAFGPRLMGLDEAEVTRRVAVALDKVGLHGVDDKTAFHLSFGQKKRAALATVLAMDAELLVLDEPTSNLDPRARREWSCLLPTLAETQLIATHDFDLVNSVCTRAILIDGGRVAADGTPNALLNDAALLEAHGL